MSRMLLLFLVGLLATFAAAAPAPLSPWQQGWDKPLDPGKDCKFIREGDALTIEVPGKEHDLKWDGTLRKNAPRLLRDVEGDFVVEVKVSGAFHLSATSTRRNMHFVEAGLVLMEKDKTYAWLVRGARRSGKETIVYSSASVKIREDEYDGCEPDTLPVREFCYLRLEREGQELRVSDSKDGKSWREWPQTWKGSEVILPRKLKLGVFAASTSKEPFKPRFDHFKLTRQRQ